MLVLEIICLYPVCYIILKIYYAIKGTTERHRVEWEEPQESRNDELMAEYDCQIAKARYDLNKDIETRKQLTDFIDKNDCADKLEYAMLSINSKIEKAENKIKKLENAKRKNLDHL